MNSNAEGGEIQRAVLLLAETLGRERTVAQAVAAVRSFVRVGDEHAARLVREHPPETPLACREGCPHCCYTGQVIVTAPEVIALADWLRTHAAPGERELLAEGAAERVKQASVPGGMVPVLPCPLLVGDRCAAYPARPFVCRGCNSLDAATCRDAFASGYAGAIIEAYAPQLELWHALRSGMAAGLLALGYPREFLDLAGALDIALNRPSSIEGWLRREPAFAEARRTAPGE